MGGRLCNINHDEEGVGASREEDLEAKSAEPKSPMTSFQHWTLFVGEPRSYRQLILCSDDHDRRCSGIIIASTVLESLMDDEGNLISQSFPSSDGPAPRGRGRSLEGEPFDGGSVYTRCTPFYYT